MKYPFLIAISSLMVCETCLAKEPIATAIIRRGETQLRGRTTQAVMTMRIERPNFSRQLTLRTWSVGQSRALVEILNPPKEEGVTSLRVESQMWNYLPNADQVVRVPTSLMLHSWMGSDFTNDDLMKASSILNDYTHRIRRYVTVKRERLVLIECLPKPGAPVVWGKIHYWARLRDQLPVRQVYFDEEGARVRTVVMGRFRKMDDRVIPSLIIIQPAEDPARRTIVEYRKILYDRALALNVFDRDRLPRTSQQGKQLASLWYSRN